VSESDARLTYKKKLGTALTTADEQTFQSLRRMCLEVKSHLKGAFGD